MDQRIRKKKEGLSQRLNRAESACAAKDREIERLRAVLRDAVGHNDQLWFSPENKLMFSHTCLGQDKTQQLDGWRISRLGYISPSIHCLECGSHFHARIEIKLTHMEWHPIGGVWGGRSPRTLFTREEKAHNGHTDRDLEGDRPERDPGLRVERHPREAGSSQGGLQ